MHGNLQAAAVACKLQLRWVEQITERQLWRVYRQLREVTKVPNEASGLTTVVKTIKSRRRR